MQLPATSHGDVLVVSLAGRINHLNSSAFEAAMTPHIASCKASGGRLLLDLSQLEYISSAGLRVLMMAAKKLLPGEGKMAVAAPQPVVREILEISRFNLVFPLYESVAVALAIFAAAKG